jgi:NAD(P)-dependent dehydrogenase (short-subunit alcohol dehydrogenase family)
MIDLTDKTALITGAARGIGEAAAIALARLGASVAMVDIDGDAVSEAARKVNEAGHRATGYQGDVLDEDSVKGVVADAIANWGAVDILVNNAGIIRDNLLENISESDWDAVVDVNLKGPFLCAKAVTPHMKSRRCGKIVNIISHAWLGKVGQSNYSASKGGLVSLTRTLALELARHGINVNGVAPGLIDTPLTRGLPSRVIERLLSMQPTGSMGTVEDVANAVCFLASDAAGFITGQILHVDGGKSAGVLSL